MKTFWIIIFEYLKSKYQYKTIKQAKYKYHLDMEAGEVTNIIKSDHIKNRVKSARINFSLFRLFFKQFERIGVIIYYIVMILHFASLNVTVEDIVVYILPLSMHFILQISKALYFDYIKMQNDRKINSRRVTRFRKLRREKILKSNPLNKELSSCRKLKTALYENCIWQDIEVGDVIYLKRNEIAPADLLLIDVSDEILKVSSQNFRGNTFDSQRQPTQLTMLKNGRNRLSGYDYKKLLTGQIQYNIHDFDIQGYIKLKKDPKGEAFTNLNMIFREEQLKTSQYVIGVVLQTGNHCFCYKHITYQEKSSFFVSKSSMFFALTFGISLIVSIISWILSSVYACQPTRDTDFTGITLIFYLVQYLKTTPIYFYNCIDLIEILMANIKYRNYISNKKTDIDYLQLNPLSIGDIVMTEYVCFDKTGTLTTGDFYIHAIIIEDAMYKFSYQKMNKNQWQIFKDNFLNQIKQDPNFQMEELDESEPDIQSKKVRHTGIFKLTVHHRTSKKMPSYESNKQPSSKSIANPMDDGDGDFENMRPEDFDDTHYRITPELSTNKPKPFFNKKVLSTAPIQLNVNVNQSQSGMNSPMEEDLLLKQSSVKDEQRSYDNKSLMSRKVVDSSSRDMRRQSIKRSMQIDKVAEEDLEIIFFRENDYYQRLMHGQNKLLFQEALLSLLLCQEIVSRYSSIDDQFMHDSTQFTYDQELLRFVSLLDVKFLCCNEFNGKIIYIIDFFGDIIEVQVMAYYNGGAKIQGALILYPESLQEKFMLINESDPMESLSYVYLMREESNQLPINIDVDKTSRDYWDKVFSKLHMAGMRSIVYSKIYLKDKEANLFIQKYQNEEGNNAFIEISKDMQIIQVIGVKEKVRNDSKVLIHQMKQADLSLYILSGDELSRVLPIAYKTKIINSNDSLLFLDNENARLTIKNHLAILSQSLKIDDTASTKPMRMSTMDKYHRTITQEDKYMVFPEIKLYSIIVSGDYFNEILEDSSLLSHFIFLLYFSNSLIAYKMSQKHKAKLVEIIQTQFQGNKKVLSIGDAYNDIFMLKQASIGVQYCHHPNQNQQYQRGNTKLKLTKKPTYQKIEQNNPLNQKFIQKDMWLLTQADICIKQFEELGGLLFFESRIFAEVYDDLLVFSFYRSLLILYILFLFYCLQCSMNLQLINGFWLTIYQSIMLFVQQLASIQSKLSRNYDKDSIAYREQFKNNIKIFKKKKILSFIFKINGNAMIDAVLLFIALLVVQDLQFDVYKQMTLLLLILSDLVKLIVSSSFSRLIWLIFIITYMISWILTSVLSAYTENIEDFTYIFIVSGDWFAILLYSFAQYCLSFIIEQIQPLFCQSLIDKTQYEEVDNYIIKPQKNSGKRYHNLIKRIAILTGKLFKNNKDEMDISISDMICEFKVNSARIHPVTLRFQNKDTEMKFKRISKQQWIKFERVKTGLALIFLEGFALIIYILTNQKDFQGTLYFIIYILSLSLQSMLLILIYSNIYSKHFFYINLAITLIKVISKMVTDFQHEGVYDILLSQCYIVIIIFQRLHIPVLNFIIATLSIIGFFQKFIYSNYYRTINGDIITVATLLLFIALQYKLSVLEKQDFMLAATLNQETTSMTNVLSILLPKFIRDRINAKGMFEIAENQGEVAILFCDICGFDDLITIEKENIVNLLDNLFRGFDALCTQNGMQKIETVGKTYMAAGGLKAVDQGTKFINQSAVKRAVQLSLEMAEYAKKFKFGQTNTLKIKIGIHYGRVIAGVIGHHKPQFSLIGDTVNTTSRVCSTGQDGEITLSNEAYMELNTPDLQFNQRTVTAKGKGELITWQIVTQIKRNNATKRKKKRGLIPKVDLKKQDSTFHKLDQPQTPKLEHKQLKNPHQMKSFEMIQRESNTRIEKQTSQESSFQSQFQSKDGGISRKKGQRGPTLIMKSGDISQGLLIQRSGSNIGGAQDSFAQLPPIIINQPEENNSSALREESYREKPQNNLLHDLSQKLRRDLYIELIDENPDYEIEIEKIQFEEDEQIISESLQLERSKFYLDFKSSQQELAQEFMEQKEGINIILILTLHFIQFLSKTMTLFYIQNNDYWSIIFIIRCISSGILFILALLQNKKLKHTFYKHKYFIITYFALLISILIEFLLMPSESIELQAAEGILLLCFFCSLPIIQIKYKVLFNFIFFLSQLFIVLIKYEDFSIAYYTIFQSAMTFIVQYNLFFQDLGTFNNKRSLELKKIQTQNLVKYLLPSHILKQFLSNNNQRMVLVDQFEEATLLFADIAGFTEYSSKVEPEQVVNMLRNLFTEFDKKCLTQNTYKLYTIGDCYVAFGIVDVAQRNPAQEAKNIVELGFEMIKTIREVRAIIGYDGLDMRIGIHSGKVIGGILGTEIVRYDVYGADVMISNKMESNGEKGKVQVSEETKILIESAFPDQFNYTFNKLVEFKSINRQTNGYFIFPVKNDSNEGFDNEMNHVDQVEYAKN